MRLPRAFFRRVSISRAGTAGKKDRLQALRGKRAAESKFFRKNLDGRPAFGYKNPRPNVFLIQKGIPWTAGKGRLSLSCCAPKRSGCLRLHASPTGFDIRRRCQMPENVEPFQPKDGPHRKACV